MTGEFERGVQLGAIRTLALTIGGVLTILLVAHFVTEWTRMDMRLDRLEKCLELPELEESL